MYLGRRDRESYDANVLGERMIRKNPAIPEEYPDCAVKWCKVRSAEALHRHATPKPVVTPCVSRVKVLSKLGFCRHAATLKFGK